MPHAKKQVRATQRDIARLARVSQATVSRVVAGDSRVDSETRDRIIAVMQEQNYQPHFLARSLRSQRSGFIGLVVKRPSGGLNDDPFFANLSAEIMDFLGPTPYHLCMEMVSQETQAATYDELLRTRRVDGLILVESELQDERLTRLLHDRFPFVVIGNPSFVDSSPTTQVPHSVDNDNAKAAHAATLHLLKNGYRSVGFLGGPAGVTVSEDRILGFKAACDEAGVCHQIWRSNFGLEAARATAMGLLGGGEMPEALVVLDDFMAMGVIQAARSMQVRIPSELGLVSFNDSRLCQLIECGLTSVKLNIREMVRTACRTLLEIIEDPSSAAPKRSIIPTEVVVRGSSQPASRVGVAL